jgi:hypothetical protein
MSRSLIGWSPFTLNGRINEINRSVRERSQQLGREVTPFTSPSEAGGNLRSRISNPYVEHKKFFSEILSGERKQATLVNYGMLLRRQLNIEFSTKSAFSTPSKSSIISDCGQYFYREIFTKLFSPVTRGYKVSEKQSRHSTYSFYQYTRWLYTFIQQRFLKQEREQLFAFLREALGALHVFFMQTLNISTTSLIQLKTVSRVDSTSQKSSVESSKLREPLNSPQHSPKSFHDDLHPLLV